jgi:hypothetical protein
MLGGHLVYHGMARPQAADEGDGLQLCRVPADILNKPVVPKLFQLAAHLQV